MTRRALERLLAQLPPPGPSAATAYLPPGSDAVALRSRLSELLPPDHAGAVAKLAAESESGAVLLRDQSQSLLVLPPLPVQNEAWLPGCDLAALLGILSQDAVIGVLLLRLGRFAVGVYRGASLVESKTGSRYVKGRHHAGGTSQLRFARIREKQVGELFKEACRVLHQRLAPHEDRLEHVFLGGERLTLHAFRRQCPYLERLGPRVRRRLLNVGEPSLKALEALPKEIWTSQVYNLE